jgi:hypothetical protein
MGDEDHVRRSLTGVQQTDVSDAAELSVEIFPLREGFIARGTVQIPGHPGVDDVVHVIELRRTHQVGGFIEVGSWCKAGGLKRRYRRGGNHKSLVPTFQRRVCPLRVTIVKWVKMKI